MSQPLDSYPINNPLPDAPTLIGLAPHSEAEWSACFSYTRRKEFFETYRGAFDFVLLTAPEGAGSDAVQAMYGAIFNRVKSTRTGSGNEVTMRAHLIGSQATLDQFPAVRADHDIAALLALAKRMRPRWPILSRLPRLSTRSLKPKKQLSHALKSATEMYVNWLTLKDDVFLEFYGGHPLQSIHLQTIGKTWSPKAHCPHDVVICVLTDGVVDSADRTAIMEHIRELKQTVSSYEQPKISLFFVRIGSNPAGDDLFLALERESLDQVAKNLVFPQSAPRQARDRSRQLGRLGRVVITTPEVVLNPPRFSEILYENFRRVQEDVPCTWPPPSAKFCDCPRCLRVY